MTEGNATIPDLHFSEQEFACRKRRPDLRVAQFTSIVPDITV